MSSPQPWQALTPEAKLPRSDSRLASATCRGITSSGRPCRRSLASPNSKRRSTPLSPLPALASPLHCWQHQDQVVSPVIQAPKTPVAKEVKRQSSLDTLVERIGELDLSQDEKGKVKAARAKSQPQPMKPSLFALLCCGGSSSSDEYYEVMRSRERVKWKSENQVSFAMPPAPPRTSRNSWIPRSLDEHTAILLQTELSKPTSIADEPGYIYMFWITPNASPPASKIVESLLDGDGPQSPMGSPGIDGKKTIMVKIGRATNVHRRLSSWSKQCGYNLSLLRFYPHASSTAPRSQGTPDEQGIRKVPFSHRVERLIHIELAGRRVKQGRCNSCGRDHREWFALAATRSGVQSADAVIRRWVRWAESQPPVV